MKLTLQLVVVFLNAQTNFVIICANSPSILNNSLSYWSAACRGFAWLLMIDLPCSQLTMPRLQ